MKAFGQNILLFGLFLFSANSFGMVINSKSIKTLNLKSFQKLENGRIIIKSESLCLHDSIYWPTISSKNVEIIHPINPNCCKLTFTYFHYPSNHIDPVFHLFQNLLAADGYVCDSMCNGCWSTQNSMCQLCKTYKLNDVCVDHCDNVTINGMSLYVADSTNRICEYCDEQCKFGCTGPVCPFKLNFWLKLLLLRILI